MQLKKRKRKAVRDSKGNALFGPLHSVRVPVSYGRLHVEGSSMADRAKKTYVQVRG